MRKNRFFVGALVAMALFISGCGDGGGENQPIINHEYVVDYDIPLNLEEAFFWTDCDSVWDPKNREVTVSKTGQSQIRFEKFSVKNGDQLDFTVEGSGGEISLRVKSGDKYVQQSFVFSGKNVISLLVDFTDVQANVIFTFKKLGKYQFLKGNISLKRTRIKTGEIKTTELKIADGQFWSDCGSTCGSTWDPKKWILNSKPGTQRSDPRIRWVTISIKKDVATKIILTGYSMPASNVVVQLRSSSSQILGERMVEFYGEEITIEIIPTGTDKDGYLYILFGLEAGVYQLKDLRIETES